MGDGLSIVRASHVATYIGAMRKAGVDVDRELAHSRLPPRIEEMPDLFVSLPLALEWIARCGRDIPPMQLGFLAAQGTTLGFLKQSHVSAILAAPNCVRRLQAVAGVVHREDSALRLSMQAEAGGLRVFCDFAQLHGHPYLCLADWVAVQGVIAIIRSIAGQGWTPVEITFKSPLPLSHPSREAFPNTRMLTGQPRSSLLVQTEELTHSSASAGAAPSDAALDSDPWTFVTLLRSAIQPYLNGGSPDLGLAADIVGMSKRTLQRRLQGCGQSYSEILQEARCELARSLLNDAATKIIDVSMITGYETPQHFSRAFRRFTGLTPTAYRRIAMAQG